MIVSCILLKEQPKWNPMRRPAYHGKGPPMIKCLLSVVLPLYAIAAQDITFLKDSIKTPNGIYGSIADSIVFTNTASTAISLDSARLIFQELDTVGLFQMLQITLSEHGRDGSIGWTINQADKIDSGEYLIEFSPWTFSRNPPFFMGLTGDSTTLKLVIANCLLCDIPKYPRYVRGLLHLYFSNGQTVVLRFYSDDLRPTAIARTSPVRRQGKGAEKGAFYLINGRKIPAQPELMKRKHLRYRMSIAKYTTTP
jgi:hypothetical protein